MKYIIIAGLLAGTSVTGCNSSDADKAQNSSEQAHPVDESTDGQLQDARDVHNGMGGGENMQGQNDTTSDGNR